MSNKKYPENLKLEKVRAAPLMQPTHVALICPAHVLHMPRVAVFYKAEVQDYMQSHVQTQVFSQVFYDRIFSYIFDFYSFCILG